LKKQNYLGLMVGSQSVIEVDRPECLTEFRHRITAPNVIDQSVQSFVPPFDAGTQPFHFHRVSVIDAYGNAVSTRDRDQFSGFFDGFWSAWCGTPSGSSSRTTTCAVNRSASAIVSAAGSVGRSATSAILPFNTFLGSSVMFAVSKFKGVGD